MAEQPRGSSAEPQQAEQAAEEATEPADGPHEEAGPPSDFRKAGPPASGRAAAPAVSGQYGPHAPYGPHGRHAPYGPNAAWHAYRPPPPPAWLVAIRPDDPPAPMRAATGWAALAAGLLAALLLGEGLGVNLLLVTIPASVAAHFAARAAGRRVRPWTLVWAAACLALLVVPALRDATWPSLLAVLAAFAVGSLSIQGGRTWLGSLLGPLGLPTAAPAALRWAWRGVRERAQGSRHRWAPAVRTSLVAVGLLVVFGALFAGADAAFADLLGDLVPEMSVGDGPVRLMLFALGLTVALAAARTAAAPWRWDRIRVAPGKARGPVEWAVPLVVLNLLFAAFNAVQLAVLFGGYDKVLEETGLTYAQYARQGFWQLLVATLLTLAVIGIALRWAPRGRRRDATLVRAVLGTLCLLTLVVVVSALRRMDLYVNAYGLTRLRISVTAVELWLGLVIVLVMIAVAAGAGRRGAAWLPRAVTATAALGVLAFGLVSPDRLVAEQNVARFERTGKIDLMYLRELSADAVPALDGLPEPQRSCALSGIARALAVGEAEPWYATSLGEVRARSIVADRPVGHGRDACEAAGAYADGYRMGS